MESCLGRRRKKKKSMSRLKRGRDILQIDDDDMDLIKENLGLKTKAEEESEAKRARFASDEDSGFSDLGGGECDGDDMDGFIVDDTGASGVECTHLPWC